MILQLNIFIFYIILCNNCDSLSPVEVSILVDFAKYLLQKKSFVNNNGFQFTIFFIYRLTHNTYMQDKTAVEFTR